MSVLPVLSVGGAIPDKVKPEEVKNVYVFSALLTLYPDEDRNRLLGLSLAEGLADSLPAPQSREEEPDGNMPSSTLVIFDQFEELFTRHADRWREREGFFKQVYDALVHYPDLHVLFSIREDYIAELTPYAGLLPDQLRSQFRLERLRERAALDAIILPAQSAGRRFDEAAAELLVTRLRGGQASRPATGAAPTPASVLVEFVEPVQLQIVCHRLWANLPDEQTDIGTEDVERYGDVALALTEFYESVVEDVVRQTRISELHLRTWFGRPPLVTPAGTKGLVYRGTTDTAGLPNEVADVLDKTFYIIRPMVRGKDTWYELAHDRLVEPIRQSNLKWRSEHAADWQPQAEKWLREGEPRARLLNKDALEKAEQWIKAQEYEPEPQEQRFLDYSRQELERQTKALARQIEKRTNLAETGWGAIFAADDPLAADIERALGELLQWRSQQAGARYQIFSDVRGYRKKLGETAQDFQTRLGVGPGLVNYDRMPYYLLIIGGPDRIPFEFQYALQAQCAVGRLDFQTTAEYASYARSVVMSENGSFSLMPKVALFGPQDAQDAATTAALDKLLRPLEKTLRNVQQDRDWEIEVALQAEATRARLLDFMGGPQTPSLLFSTSWGASTPKDDPEQEALQGAVMLQVNPTPQPFVKPESPEAYLAAHDISDDARLLGSIAFLFGAWSAGTPRFNNFPAMREPPQEIASRPFVARLPQRLMGHPKGGMLAVIGHVDMTFTGAFTWRDIELAMNHFGGTLRRLMEGYTVGAAVEPINQRYALLSSMLADELQQVFFYGGKQDDAELTELNRYTVDARNFIILGDPAVRLPLESGPMALERPAIEPVHFEEKPEPLESLPTSAAAGEPEPVAKGLVPAQSRGLQTGPEESQAPQGAGTEVAPPESPPSAKGAGRSTGSERLLYFNGINGATGQYVLPPMTIAELVKIILTEQSPENLSELKWKASSRERSL